MKKLTKQSVSESPCLFNFLGWGDSATKNLKIIGSRNTFIQAAIKIYNASGIDVTNQFNLTITADNEMELTAIYAVPGIYYIKDDALHTTKLTLIPR